MSKSPAHNMQSVTSNAVAIEFINQKYIGVLDSLDTVGWYKIAEIGRQNYGFEFTIEIASSYYYQVSCSHKITLCYGFKTCNVFDFANDVSSVIDKVKVCWTGQNADGLGVYIHYNSSNINLLFWRMSGSMTRITTYNLVTDSITWEGSVESNLGTNGFYVNGTKIG